MLDFVSIVTGAVCAGIPFWFFSVWVAAQAYELGWHDRDEGRWIGGELKKEEAR